MTVTTTYKDTPTKTVDAGGARFAYRQLGPDSGTPVIFLNHLAGVLDNSADLARRLPNARLELYPDAGHGGIFQYHDTFVDQALKFLGA